jgi:hypothetical protein
MVKEGKLSPDDYNFPLRQFYKYKKPAHLKGAERSGGMSVEFAVVIRVEFIPAGSTTGPVKDIYFKVFKKGTCGIIGAVIGWPNLDIPSMPGGEGLGWFNGLNGAEFKSLGVTIPRLDDQRKTSYNASVARYTASQGQLMAIDDVTGDRVHLIDADKARQLRAAAMMANSIPFAQMENMRLEFFVLSPGDRAVAPIQWSMNGAAKVAECSTHPGTPDGLVVLCRRCQRAG